MSFRTFGGLSYPGRERSADWRRYCVAQDEAECERIGHLRRRAYGFAGKVRLSDEPLLDVLDRQRHVRLLYLRDGADAPIATARLAMPDGNHERVDHDNYFAWPGDFPSRRLCGEVSRVAVEPTRDRRGLMRAMVMGVGLDLLRHGRHYLVGSAAGSLLSYYAALGGRIMPIGYRHAELGNLRHRAFIVDVRGVVSGRVRVRPLIWSTVIAPLCQQALAERLLAVNGLYRARLRGLAIAGSIGGLAVLRAARLRSRS